MPRRDHSRHHSPLVRLPEQSEPLDVERTRAVADEQAARAAEWDPAETDLRERDARIIAVREGRAESGYLAIDDAGRNPGDPFTARDEWLIAGEDLTDAVRRALDRRGLTTSPVELLQDRVHVVQLGPNAIAPDGDPPRERWLREHLAQIADELRAADPTAPDPFRPQHLAPMGVVVKADSPPRPAPGLGPLPERGPADRIDQVRQLLRRPRPMRIAVIDTGIADLTGVLPPDPGDPDADQRRTDGWLADLAVQSANVDRVDDLPDDDRLDDGAGHGTFIAGIIEQIAPRAVVTVFRALDSDGLGGEAAAATAMVRAAEKADILNLSFGTETLGDIEPLALTVAVDIIREQYPNVLLVAAAGNFGHDRPCWPAALKGVIAVGGLTRDMAPARWSTRGHWVDCSAIGEAVLSTFVNGIAHDDKTVKDWTFPAHGATDSWAVWSGTSFAVPQIAAAVASICRWGEPPLHAWQRLMQNRQHVRDFGRIIEVLPPT